MAIVKLVCSWLYPKYLFVFTYAILSITIPNPDDTIDIEGNCFVQIICNKYMMAPLNPFQSSIFIKGFINGIIGTIIGIALSQIK